ncbi:UNVERIFIED_CONTAM: hypothetical protein PYX00_001148 [Menopon gallinae]|uniref:Peroxidase n=1 Tax=Menopon gallinae TaxID=328185 RepID=A0AAW2IBT9_9NEOP
MHFYKESSLLDFDDFCEPLQKGALIVAILLTTVFYSVEESSSSTNDRNDSDRLSTTFYNTTWPLKDVVATVLNEDLQNSNVSESAYNGLVSQRQPYGRTLPKIDIRTPSLRHQLSMATSEKARTLANYGLILEMAAKRMPRRFFNESGEKCRMMTEEWFSEEGVCLRESAVECAPSPHRSFDGSCNNLRHPKSWGVALRPFRRILFPDYTDGISAPKNSRKGRIPSAREVSLKIHRPLYVKDMDFTVMLAVWGQFVDHDMTATALSQGRNGEVISCCDSPPGRRHPECFVVPLGMDDPFYKEYNVSCMDFVRSAPAPLCGFGPREQLNQASSFIDGSVVYGNSKDISDELRTFINGELKMLLTPDEEELLPVSSDPSDGCNREEEFKRGRYCFLTGDLRSNENLHLVSMHLIFARQHNRIARKLADLNPHWKDETLFQESRKILGAQIQHITYEEFLPSVLPRPLLQFLNLTAASDGYFRGYNSTVNPSIANVFAAAAFRFGHSLLPGLMKLISNDTSSEEYFELHKMLFNPFGLYDVHFLEKVVRGALNTSVERNDVYFSREVTEKLFQENDKKGPCGLDLVSLNIQRGRDHGLPGYPEWRVPCGLTKIQDFADLEGVFDPESLKNIRNLYRTVSDIDLFTGGLAEIPVEGGMLGPTFTCLIADQFLRLKVGDRYWYENGEAPQAFTQDQLKELRKTTLARIICDNTDIGHSQPMVMRRAGLGNERKACTDLPFPDFDKWKERRR